MKIETKFNVNDLTKHKYETNPENFVGLLEVMEVLSQTCYAGTQVFYLCRPLIAQKKYNHAYKEEGSFIWVISHGVNNTDDNKIGWKKYREDELKTPKQEHIDLILNGGEDKTK